MIIIMFGLTIKGKAIPYLMDPILKQKIPIKYWCITKDLARVGMN